MKFLDAVLTSDVAKTKNILKDRFTKNLKFFESKDKKLFELLSIKPSMFGLVADDGGVNILNIATNTLVYPVDENGKHMSIEACRAMAANPLSHTKWCNAFEINPFYMALSELTITAPVSKNMFGFAATTAGLDLHNITMSDNCLPFAFLYGLGGGFVLEAMLEHYERIDGLFIYEPFPDFFGISAYFVDYEELFSRVENVFLHVEEAPSNIDIKCFLTKVRFLALYPRLELTMFDTPQIQNVKHSVSIEAGSLFMGFGSYEDEMIGWRNSAANASYGALKYKVLKEYDPEKINTPICVVGNGGSLDGSMEFLRRNQDKMIIFSAGTALRSLLKNGIKPDFQIEIERTDYLHGILKESGMDSIDMIAASVVDPKTLATTSGEKFIFFRDYSAHTFLNLSRGALPHASPFVGNAALSLAVRMAKTVILCGMDVGYKKGRTAHSKDSIYEETLDLPPNSVPVKANFEDSEMYSNDMFNLSRWVLEFAIDEQKGAVAVLNMSDGAYIEGASPCKIPELKDTDKAASKIHIKSLFSDKSQEVFCKDGDISLDEGIARLKQELMNIFLARVNSKDEFFHVIAAFDIFTARIELERSVAFLLFGGSIRHIVFSMYVAVLHSNPVDFAAFYDKCVEILFGGFESMVSDFKKSEAKRRAGSLLSSIQIP